MTVQQHTQHSTYRFSLCDMGVIENMYDDGTAFFLYQSMHAFIVVLFIEWMDEPKAKPVRCGWLLSSCRYCCCAAALCLKYCCDTCVCACIDGSESFLIFLTIVSNVSGMDVG